MKMPRELFPIGRVGGRFAEYLAGFPVLILLAVVFGNFGSGLSLLALPLGVLLQGALLVGIALLLSSLNVLLRDVERIMRLVTRILFYASPIIYPLALVQNSSMPEWVKVLYQLNPLVGIFQLHHAVWYPEEFPDAGMLTVSVVGSLLLLVCGWWVFRRLEPTFLKEL
jgi:ABC-2 type transport system permease protein